MAAGTIRGDQIYPPGLLKLKDVMNCFPFEDPCVVIKVTGRALHAALENSVSQYPALEGRFPQVSNIEFEFDPSKPPNSRVNYVNIGGERLEESKVYTLVTRGYMARGKDGFDSLLVESEGGEAEEIVSEENGILISMLIRQYFMSLKTMGQWKMWSKSLDRHWKGVQRSMSSKQLDQQTQSKQSHVGEAAGNLPTSRSKNGGVSIPDTEEDPLDESDTDISADEAEDVKASKAQRERQLNLARKVTKKWWRLAGLSGQPKCMDDVHEFTVDWTKVSYFHDPVLPQDWPARSCFTNFGLQAIAPILEGRIRIIGASEDDDQPRQG
jgi:hypothetical protein